MRISEQGLKLIRSFEGFSAIAYTCPAGYPTIGYGHVVKSGETFAGAMDESAALALLRADVADAEAAIGRLVMVPLTQFQFDALASFIYNVGAGAFQRSTLKRKVNREEHEDAALEFGRWIWAGGRKLPGLVKRRAAEAALYNAGNILPEK